MRYMILIFSIVFLSACSPKYKVVKEYVAPKVANGSDSICMGVCQNKKNSCKSSCKIAFDSCKIKADKVAQKRYKQKMQNYIKALENYAQQVDRYNFETSFYYMDDPFCYANSYYGDPFFPRRLFWYNPVYRPTSKPKKPSLEAEKLKAEGEICDLDCGCSKIFDDCFIGCGGSIISKKVCIENCPND